MPKFKKRLPLSIGLGIGVPTYTYVLEPLVHGDMGRMQRQTDYYMFGKQEDGTGYQLTGPAKFYGPMVVGVLAHKVIGKYVNPYIPSWLPVCF